jgi:hypothetical protein
MTSLAARWRDPALAVLVGGWVVFRLVLVAGGARFSDDYLEYGWQLVPVETLRDDPLGSVWNLHVQPPLHNLLVGVVLRWSPLPDALSLQIVMLTFALALALALWRIVVRLGLSPMVAAVVVLAVTCDPELVRYEFGATYEMPVAALVTVAVWAAVRFLDRPTTRRLAGLAAVLTAVTLTRSLLHPVWLTAFIAVVLWATRGRWRARDVALVALVPVVAVGGWLVKNQALFGEATLSSWFGMNLQRAVVAPVPAGDLEAMIADGTVSAVSGVPPFTAYEAYEPLVAPCSPGRDHPAAAEPARANGVANFNFECYLAVYDELGVDAWTVARTHPDRWLYGRGWALVSTMARSSNAPGLDVAVFHAVESAYHVALVDVPVRLSMAGWAFPLNPAGYVPVDVSGVLSALLVVLVVLGVRAVVRLVRASPDPVADVVVVLCAGTALFVVGVGALFELGENMRFRATVNPLYLGVPLALGVKAVLASPRLRRGDR